MYTSPSEWTISKYSIPFEIIPSWFPPTSKDIWETCIYKNTHEYIYISKTATNASRIILLDRVPPFVYMHLMFFPLKSSVNLSPRQNLFCISNYHAKWPLEGLSAPHQVTLSVARAHRKRLSWAPVPPGSQESGMGLGEGFASMAILGKFKFS